MAKQDAARLCVPIGINKKNLIELKRQKKDGSLDQKIINAIVANLYNKKIILLPVDCIYGFIGLFSKENEEKICKISGLEEESLVRLISSFRMLDGIAQIGKLEFDFLHRIWPGEITVYLNKPGLRKQIVPVRMPRSKYMLDIISLIDHPLYYGIVPSEEQWHIYDKQRLIKKYKNLADMLVLIDEFCKEHSEPSIVDISKGSIEIINNGRVASEEIKSLYFLGKDDISV